MTLTIKNVTKSLENYYIVELEAVRDSDIGKKYTLRVGMFGEDILSAYAAAQRSITEDMVIERCTKGYMGDVVQDKDSIIGVLISTNIIIDDMPGITTFITNGE